MKSITKLKTLAIIVFASLMLVGCSSKNNAKIGFLIPAREGYRWIIDEKYLAKACEANGYELIVRSAENDENLQIKQGSELIEMGVDVLIVASVNANNAGAIIREAHNHNIPVIGYDRLIMNCDLDYFITFEGEKIGAMMLEPILAQKPNGNYVFLYGDPTDNNALYIKEAQEKIVAPYIASGQMNVVYKSFVEDWNSDNATHTLGKVLSHSSQNIDAIIASADGLSIGAIAALKEAGYSDSDISKIYITGQDAELEAIRSINKGIMTNTLYKSIPQTAALTMEMVKKIANKKSVSEINGEIDNGRKSVPSVFLTPQIITKDKISIVVDDGFLTWDQINGED